MVTGQGLAILLAGVIASVAPPWAVVAVAGGLGFVIATGMAVIKPARSRGLDLAGGVAVALDR
jgi:F0F1-type ATP synthase assembly protein I